jgi:acyl-CoA reductase-like NAD-dependent aldehyde dehydrogenase
MSQLRLGEIVRKQRDYFSSGETREISWRVERLKDLRKAITENEREILKALEFDMKKPPLEAYASEIRMVVNEITYAIKNINSWAEPKRVKTPLDHFLASSFIHAEPLGAVLIIGPWNYPFQLVLSPLVGAIAAGNCSIVKPSEIALYSSAVIARILGGNFEPNFISVVEGGPETTQRLLAEKFDHIFFPGGTHIGKIVMEAAAKHLTPVTLELGGKSPCIVDCDVHIEYAARRITWGKFLNAGQTCVAPDYLLVDRSIKDELLERMKTCIREFYGDDPSRSPDYGRIINERHFDRLSRLLQDGEIIIGGDADAGDRYIAPTVIDRVSWTDEIMQEEIFGPILPVIEYGDLAEAISAINERPKPLSLCFFSTNRGNQEKVLRDTSSGGVCINDTIIHLATRTLPFGGVGESGMGSYHGKASFDTFSHQKSVLRRSLLFDTKLRYPPYRDKLKYLKWFS